MLKIYLIKSILFQDFLPTNHSALVVEDFETVKQLADTVHRYDKDDKLYSKLLEHKYTGIITNKKLKRLLRLRSKHDNKGLYDFDCFLCEKAHEAIAHKSRGKPIPKSIATHSQYPCGEPGQFDDNGKYDPKRTRYWERTIKYAKAKVCVIRKLVSEQRQVSEDKFFELIKYAEKYFEKECQSMM